MNKICSNQTSIDILIYCNKMSDRIEELKTGNASLLHLFDAIVNDTGPFNNLPHVR